MRLAASCALFALIIGFAACRQTGSRWTLPKNAPIVPHKVALDRGDILIIKVFGEKDLTGRFQISDAGTIDFPLVGRLKVAGLKPSSVALVLQKRLAAGYIRNPQVSVLAKGYQEKRKIIVWGQVRKSGTFKYRSNMTLIEAITLAGGLSPLADKAGVRVTRLRQGRPKHYSMSISDAKTASYRLNPGDVIYVPERVF